jgi:hypothetical protein
MSGWKGTLNFNSGAVLVAQVQYAVYAPTMYGGKVPVPANNYVYAYQLYNVGSAALTTLTVGLPIGSGAANGGTDAACGDIGGIDPSFANVYADTFTVTFLTHQLPPVGGHSVVLLFTSPNGPTTTEAFVADGDLISAPGAPAPLPEPATLILLGLSGLALRRKHFLRHIGCGITVANRTAIARAVT